MPRKSRSISHNEKEVFVQIYQQHHTAVFNYIYFRVGNADLAEEFASDVFVRLVEKYDLNSRRGRPILPWLYTIARNLVIDHHRRKERVQWSPLDEITLPDDPNTPAQTVQKQLESECLSKAFQHLTEEQRQVILLKFIERRKNSETGEILGKTEGAVKALQHRALQALRVALQKEPCYEA